MKEKIGNKTKFVGAGMSIGVLFVAFVLVFGNSGNVLVERPVIEHMRVWNRDVLLPLGDADPGAGNSGVLRVFLVKNGTTDYNSNISAPGGNVYAYGDDNNSELANGGDSVPFGEAFDIVVKVRWNQTHAAVDGVYYWNTYTSGYCNCSDLSVNSAEMERFNISGVVGTDFCYMHYVINDKQLTKNQQVSSCSFNFNAYY